MWPKGEIVANPYRLMGVVLLIAGSILAATFYLFATSVPLTGIGLSVLTLGLTFIFLANGRPNPSDQAYQILLKTYNRIFVWLTVGFGVIDIVLAVSGQNNVVNYFIGNAIGYFVITLLFVDLSPRAKTSLNSMNAIIFTVFLVAIAFRVISIVNTIL
jgi:hypothetical protein